MKPKALVVHASGTNRDHDVVRALAMAGADPHIVHINALRDDPARLSDYQMLVLPGGFSYGDDLGAGRLWAVALRHRLGEDLDEFIAAGRPVLGICNGFQALVKSGVLPAVDRAQTQLATLTHNASGRFECRWIELEPNPESTSIWIGPNQPPIHCPVAHGEGRFVTDPATLTVLEERHQVALRYRVADPTAPYPDNPNGSVNDIAGITNLAGNVLGLMPHPENHIVADQHPTRHRGQSGGTGLPLFKNGVDYAAQM